MGKIDFSISPLPYDTIEYSRTLAHIGTPVQIPELPAPLLARPIGETGLFDVFGPWPYSSPPENRLFREGIKWLAERGFVTMVAVFRPGLDQGAIKPNGPGISVSELKPHFMYDPEFPPLSLSSRTRQNISRGLRNWVIKRIELGIYWETIVGFHRDLATRRVMSSVTRVPAAHFQGLSSVPGITTLGAFDPQGLGGVLIAAESQNEIHFLHMVGEKKVYKTGAFYALVHTALSIWGKSCRIFFGGAPDGADSPGVSKFKKRFANRVLPVFMVNAVLDPVRYDCLAERKSTPGFFPAYRSPFA
jgi:hypothetical protein